MAWLRIDDQFAAHPKVAQLTDREFRVHVRVLCYCAQYRTRGRLPLSIWTEIRGLTQTMGSHFVQLGIWDKDDEELRVHDWAKYNPGDPTKAQRQARWRARRNASVDGDVDTDVDDGRDADVDPPARARARGPVPNPSFTPQPPAGEVTEEDRLEAWRTYARGRPNVRDVEAYAQSRFVAGGWPAGHEPKPHVDVTLAASRWIAGHGWDETFTDEMVLEEFDRIARKAHGELDYAETQQLLEQWRTAKAERYPDQVKA